MLVNRLFPLQRPNSETLGMGIPMMELIITLYYLIVHSEVQLSTPTMTITIVDECLLNYSKMKQPIGRGRIRARGMEGMGADFMSENRHFMDHEKPMPRLI